MKIVGQDNVLKDLGRIFEIFINSECKIRPHFVLTGSSGSGKSITIRHLAEKHKIGYLEVNAAQLTKEGTSGNSLSKALTPLLQLGNQPVVVFVDEFDKLFIAGNSNRDLAHETTNGVQNEFLDVLEGNTTSVFGDYGKYISVPTKRILFVFAGAFNGQEKITIDDLRSFGVKTEFIGRVGLIYNTNELTVENMYEILEHSSLLTSYIQLFDDIDRETVILEIKAYIRDNHQNNTIGARLINTLINQYFIKGGLPKNEAEKIIFQKKMKFDDNSI